jgi:hypothetical protein
MWFLTNTIRVCLIYESWRFAPHEKLNPLLHVINWLQVSGKSLVRVGENPATYKLKKLGREPLVPKKSLNPYFIFQQEQTESLRAENPQLKRPDVLLEVTR